MFFVCVPFRPGEEGGKKKRFWEKQQNTQLPKTLGWFTLPETNIAPEHGIGILLSYWGGLFLGATLVSGRVGFGHCKKCTPLLRYPDSTNHAAPEKSLTEDSLLFTSGVHEILPLKIVVSHYSTILGKL